MKKDLISFNEEELKNFTIEEWMEVYDNIMTLPKPLNFIALEFMFKFIDDLSDKAKRKS